MLSLFLQSKGAQRVARLLVVRSVGPVAVREVLALPATAEVLVLCNLRQIERGAHRTTRRIELLSSSGRHWLGLGGGRVGGRGGTVGDENIDGGKKA